MGSPTLFVAVSTPGPTGPAGYSPKYIVTPGTPGSGVGNNNDMYINSTNSDLYGPKTAGVWGAVVANLRGATGATGAIPHFIVAAGVPGGGTGVDGDLYINSTTDDLYGPKTSGSWGAIVANLRGATGATGPAGLTGPPGVAYTPRGAWSSASVSYLQGDEVTDASAAWICLVNHTSSAGNRPSTPTPATWQALAGGLGQTPWVSDIDGASFTLKNVGKEGVGNDATVLPDANSANHHILVGDRISSTTAGEVTLLGNGTGPSTVGMLNFSNYAISAAEKRLALLLGATDGSQDSGTLLFYTMLAGVLSSQMTLSKDGKLGIGSAPIDTLSARPKAGTGFAGLTVQHQANTPTDQTTITALHNLSGYGWRQRVLDADGSFALDVQYGGVWVNNVIVASSVTGRVQITNLIGSGIPLYTENYNFFIGGLTITPGANSVTVKPLPGLSGADSNHYVLLTGGVGPNEVVLLTGGSTTNLQFTCSNSHTNIQSATAGLQEAHNDAPLGGCVINLANSEIDVYAVTTVTKSVRFQGVVGLNTNAGAPSNMSSTIIPHTANQVVFRLINTVFGVTLSDFAIIYPSAQGANSAIWLDDAVQTVVRYCYIRNAYVPINASTSWSTDQFHHNIFSEFQSVCIEVGSHGGMPDIQGPRIESNDFYTSVSGATAIHNTMAGALTIRGNGFHCTCSVGVHSVVTSGTGQLTITSNQFDGILDYPIFLNDTADMSGVVISDNYFGNWHSTTGIYTAIWVTPHAKGVVIIGNHLNTVGPTGGTIVGIIADGTGVVIDGNILDGPFDRGIQVQNGTDVRIGSGNQFFNGVVAQIVQFGSPTRLVIMGGPMPYSQISSLTPADGSQIFVTDGKVTSGSDNTLTSGGTGCLAIRCNGAWRAFAFQN